MAETPRKRPHAALQAVTSSLPAPACYCFLRKWIRVVLSSEESIQRDRYLDQSNRASSQKPDTLDLETGRGSGSACACLLWL